MDRTGQRSFPLPLIVKWKAKQKNDAKKGRRAIEDGWWSGEEADSTVCNERKGGQLNRLICITISRDIISFRCRLRYEALNGVSSRSALWSRVLVRNADRDELVRVVGWTGSCGQMRGIRSGRSVTTWFCWLCWCGARCSAVCRCIPRPLLRGWVRRYSHNALILNRPTGCDDES